MNIISILLSDFTNTFIYCCTGREHLQKVDLPKVEAKGAQYVAAASISVVVSVTVVVVLLDAVTLVTTIARHSKHYPKHKFKRC